MEDKYEKLHTFTVTWEGKIRLDKETILYLPFYTILATKRGQLSGVSKCGNGISQTVLLGFKFV